MHDHEALGIRVICTRVDPLFELVTGQQRIVREPIEARHENLFVDDREIANGQVPELALGNAMVGVVVSVKGRVGPHVLE
jgi:hypothetical protein